MTHEARRGDVVLIAFPFVAGREMRRKLRPAAVVQADRYNRRRDAVILAAITSARSGQDLPAKVRVRMDSPEGRAAGLRLDSMVDCQTLATLPKEEIVRTIGRFDGCVLEQVDRALAEALGMPPPRASRHRPS